MKKFIQNKLGLIVLLLLFVGGCNDLSLAPSNEFTEENYWTSTDKALTVLNTAYGQMSNSGYFFFNEALSDNAYIGRGNPFGVNTISQGTHNSSTDRFEGQWNMHYSGIKTVHVLLENIDRVPDMDQQIKARIKAEARFIRAWHYFKLTNWFGDVPFFTEDISLEESQTLSRTPHSEIVNFINEELNAIQPDLPTNTELSTENQGRITRGAAIALNARVHLYDNNWDGVLENTNKLVGTSENGDYALYSSYRELFLPANEYNNEIIMSFQFVAPDRTHNTMIDMVPLTTGARVNTMAPLQDLVDAYRMQNGQAIDEAGSGYDPDNPYQNRDPRMDGTIVRHLSEWENADGSTRNIYIEPGTAPNEDAARDEYQGQGSNSTSTGYYLRKYYDPTVTSSFNSGLNLITIRYADVLLMHAEALYEMNGQLTQSEWDDTIGALRDRAGMDNSALDYPAPGADLQDIIRNERRVELAMEGLRIHDLRRWRTAEDKLNGRPQGAPFVGDQALTERSFNPARDYLWPIPLSERDLNDNLGQNDNY